jgi:hypothetical protein
VHLDAKDMEALQTMRESHNGAELVQNAATVNWMRNAIPKYSLLIKQHLLKYSMVNAAGLGMLQPQCHCYTFGDQRSKRLFNI